MARASFFVAATAALGLTALAACQARPDAQDSARRPEADSSAASGVPVDVERTPPEPTEQGMIEERERKVHGERKRWIEYMHESGGRIDWRAIERENGEREVARRNRLSKSGAKLAVRNHWSEVGSRNLAGRTHCAAWGPGGPEVAKLYVGSSGGGIWRGNMDGTNWEPLGDDLYGGAHEIVILPGENPGEPDVMVVATDGGQLHVSRDEGESWELPIGLPALSSVRGLATLHDAQRTILVYGQFNSGGTKPGVFASTDYGRSFQNRWTGTQNFSGSMWVPRRGAGAVDSVYLLHKGQLLVSHDAAMSFTTVVTINALADGAVLAGSEAGSPTLYAALRASNSWKLYRSLDGGTSFAWVYDINDFYETLCASSLDQNRIVFGGLEIWRSANGGGTFTKMNGWAEYYANPASKLHADSFGIHCIPDETDPANEAWYISTDGGLYEVVSWSGIVYNLCLQGLGISQYYSTHTSHSDPDVILAGSQDQGYQRGILGAPSGSGASTEFEQLISGDYGHLTSSDGSHALVYSTYPGFVLIQDGAQNPVLRTASFPTGSNHAWLPPVVADPLDATKFFFCGEKLYRYDRVSPSTWTPVQHSTFNFLVGTANYISALAFAPSDPMRVYAVNDKGRLFYSADHGVNWSSGGSGAPPRHYFYGNTLAVHPDNALEAVVGGSGYSVPGVRRTLDGGATWTALNAGLPATLVYDLAYAVDGTGDVFAATETGAWQWVRANGAWQNIMQSGTPITTYWSVEALADGETMRFGTYGRGIWDYDIPAPGGEACWVVFGTNLGGANVLTIDSQTLPRIGTTPRIDVTAPGTTPLSGWIYSSTGTTVQSFLGGTNLLDTMLGLVRVRVDASGTGSAGIPIPDDPSLIGQSRYFQAFLLDASQPGGVALSNGLEAVFGP